MRSVQWCAARGGGNVKGLQHRGRVGKRDSWQTLLSLLIIVLSNRELQLMASVPFFTCPSPLLPSPPLRPCAALCSICCLHSKAPFSFPRKICSRPVLQCSLPLFSSRLIYPALYVYSIYMHVTVSRQGTSRATTIDLCVLSKNSVPKLVCHASCSQAFPFYAFCSLSWHSSCTFVVFLTRASTSIVQQWLGYKGGLTKGGGQCRKVF